jgi:hypothetical protein
MTRYLMFTFAFLSIFEFKFKHNSVFVVSVVYRLSDWLFQNSNNNLQARPLLPLLAFQVDPFGRPADPALEDPKRSSKLSPSSTRKSINPQKSVRHKNSNKFILLFIKKALVFLLG